MIEQEQLFKAVEVETGRLQQIVRAKVPYIIRGVASESDAIREFNIEESYEGVPFHSLSVDGHAGKNAFFVNVVYQSPNYNARSTELDAGECEINVDCMSRQVHITQSLSTAVCRNREGENVSFNRAIGVDKDGVIQGCDVYTSSCSFTVRKQMKLAQFSGSKRVAMTRLCNKVNADAFLGYADGEVLFTGYTASYQGTDPDTLVTLVFHFLVSPNESNIAIGPWTVSKKGHQYLWVRQVESHDETHHMVVMTPDVIAIENIYESESFAVLGLR